MNESEKSRILSLHENLRVNNSNLLMEQDSESIVKYFEEQKKKYSNFPDGKVVPITGGGFGYQTNNGIVLYPDGTAYNANGIKAVEKWTDEPYVVSTVTQTTTVLPTTTQTTTIPVSTQKVTVQPSFDDLASEKDLRQGNRREMINQRRADKKAVADRKTRVSDCTTAVNNYITYKLGSKPDTDPDKQQYISFFKTKCADLEEINLKLVGL